LGEIGRKPEHGLASRVELQLAPRAQSALESLSPFFDRPSGAKDDKYNDYLANRFRSSLVAAEIFPPPPHWIIQWVGSMASAIGISVGVSWTIRQMSSIGISSTGLAVVGDVLPPLAITALLSMYVGDVIDQLYIIDEHLSDEDYYVLDDLAFRYAASEMSANPKQLLDRIEAPRRDLAEFPAGLITAGFRGNDLPRNEKHRLFFMRDVSGKWVVNPYVSEHLKRAKTEIVIRMRMVNELMDPANVPLGALISGENSLNATQLLKAELSPENVQPFVDLLVAGHFLERFNTSADLPLIRNWLMPDDFLKQWVDVDMIKTANESRYIVKGVKRDRLARFLYETPIIAGGKECRTVYQWLLSNARNRLEKQLQAREAFIKLLDERAQKDGRSFFHPDMTVVNDLISSDFELSGITEVVESKEGVRLLKLIEENSTPKERDELAKIREGTYPHLWRYWLLSTPLEWRGKNITYYDYYKLQKLVRRTRQIIKDNMHPSETLSVYSKTDKESGVIIEDEYFQEHYGLCRAKLNPANSAVIELQNQTLDEFVVRMSQLAGFVQFQFDQNSAMDHPLACRVSVSGEALKEFVDDPAVKEELEELFNRLVKLGLVSSTASPYEYLRGRLENRTGSSAHPVTKQRHMDHEIEGILADWLLTFRVGVDGDRPVTFQSLCERFSAGAELIQVISNGARK